jgi:hypothetical protein
MFCAISKLGFPDSVQSVIIHTQNHITIKEITETKFDSNAVGLKSKFSNSVYLKLKSYRCSLNWRE